ncbi:MAG: acyl-CoA dehydrogenase, partial [Paracoccaceae bacterium]|nr:acyl-CoA dehydrogenase [Paracoccaceae bacterium]
MPYRAPIADFRFIFDHIVNLPQVAATNLFTDATADMVDAILTEAGKLSETVLAPLQREGDKQGARLENGIVRT